MKYGKYDLLSDAELHGIPEQEIRTCIIPEDGELVVPHIHFDLGNKTELPCNRIIPELGTIRHDLSTKAVPRKGCATQRELGLCPRGFGPERK